jgi:hypothetical protein
VSDLASAGEAPRRGRRASLPTAAVARSSPVVKVGLVVVATDEDGSPQGSYDFTRVPAPGVLREELAAAFARTVGPTGPWRRRATCEVGFNAVRRFATWLGDMERPPSSLAELTPGMWNDWRLAHSTRSTRIAVPMRVRCVLRNAPVISQDARSAMERRLPVPPSTGAPAFSADELRRMRNAALRTARETARRISATAAALDGEDARARTLTELLRAGDLPPECIRGGTTSLTAQAQSALGVTEIGLAYALAFPTAREAAAMGILLACERGWNRSVVEDLEVPSSRADAQDGSEEPIFIADLEKPRSGRDGRHQQASISSGSGMEALQLIATATNLTRRAMANRGTPTNRLIVYRNVRGTGDLFRMGLPVHATDSEWAKEMRLVDDNGQQLSPSFRRIRTTLQVMDRQPRQNTRSVHNRAYVMSDPAVRREAATIVAAGQEMALRVAEGNIAMKVMDKEMLALIEKDVAAASELTGISPDVLIDLSLGARDTATVACTDMTSSPWGKSGDPCGVSFLLCLACRNAVVTPDHLPRLVFLQQAMGNLGGTLVSAVWEARWQPHYSRLSDALDRISTSEERQASLTRVTDADRSMVEALLRGGMDA